MQKEPCSRLWLSIVTWVTLVCRGLGASLDLVAQLASVLAVHLPTPPAQARLQCTFHWLLDIEQAV